MQKIRIYLLLITVTFFSVLILPILAQSNNELTISAAGSLTAVLEEIKPIYEQQNPQTTLVYNFGSSGSLQQQIEQGAPVDVFFSAAARQMDALASKNLIITQTRRDLLSNDLVLITPTNTNIISSFTDLTKPEIQNLAIGDPGSVPAGQYAEEILTFYGILEQVKDKLVYGRNVSQVLNFVETGNVDGGILFLTDSKNSERIQVVATAPPESHSPVVYPIAVLTSSQQPELAQEFINFLAGSEAQAIFSKYGFTTKE
ncbi:MAG: molybdate ABC transporter substrate-binding protein [Gloeocapsa sp. DLM2.Bin57]|nr:MAG: molybdate ABC transporter substrate-binding protein [Gloeocapsa sp. DLM2.Bin57]